MSVWWEGLILVITGLFVGFINTVAGGATALLYPVLIFLGMPVHTAMGTGRVAFVFQGLSGVKGYRSKGFYIYPFNFYVALSSMAGAVAGSFLNLRTPGEILTRLLAVAIVGVVIMVWKMPGNRETRLHTSGKHLTLAVIAFFFLGIYGGYIHTGTGLWIMFLLQKINGMNLHQANSVKAMVVLLYTLPALLIFALHGQVDWTAGFILAAGNATGAWIGSRWTAGKDEKFIRYLFSAAGIILAVKLWLF
jgi:uncharacterized membrane protein YfcA